MHVVDVGKDASTRLFVLAGDRAIEHMQGLEALRSGEVGDELVSHLRRQGAWVGEGIGQDCRAYEKDVIAGTIRCL